MRCNKARSYLSQAMDEQLPGKTARDLDLHLDSCSSCREYRADLLAGRRLLAATSPSLGEDFDWRLQLKLNQALQRTAGETAYPWQETGPVRSGWFGPFTTAASLGLAAVLALAMFMGPVSRTGAPGAREAMPASGALARSGHDSDRLPLTRRPGDSPFGMSGAGLRSVSREGGWERSAGSRGFALEPAWTGNHLEDLMTIQELRLRNQRLNNQLYQYQRELSVLRARLDRADSNGLDLGE